MSQLSSFTGNLEEVLVPPASKTFSGATPSEPEAQKAFFSNNGFLVIRNLISNEDVTRLREEIQAISRNYKNITPIREGFDCESEDKWASPDEPALRKVGGIYDHSELFRAHCHHPTVIATLQNIMAEKIRLWRDVVMMKLAKVGREKPWHQDSVYWPYKPYRQVSVMTALDAVTLANGCLQVLPGSHKEAREHFGAESQVTLTEAEQRETTYVPLEPGDALFFHGLLLHGSEPNNSDHHRRVCIYSYMPSDLEYIGAAEEAPYAADITS